MLKLRGKHKSFRLHLLHSAFCAPLCLLCLFENPIWYITFLIISYFLDCFYPHLISLSSNISLCLQAEGVKHKLPAHLGLGAKGHWSRPPPTADPHSGKSPPFRAQCLRVVCAQVSSYTFVCLRRCVWPFKCIWLNVLVRASGKQTWRASSPSQRPPITPPPAKEHICTNKWSEIQAQVLCIFQCISNSKSIFSPSGPHTALQLA